MSLKQSVVVVNEYTVKTNSGGTRGGTPGDYVLRYMSRDGATEDLTPIRRDTENFITRYMAREDAVDEAISVPELKEQMRQIQGDGGVAFGYGDFSLSHKKLKQAAKDIQKNFDEGKTVMKTVLSFDEEYLKKYGIVDEDFELQQPGDYKGNIDQMKLRMAIMNGMEKLGRHYDDLQYIGVIQVDTKHVHCHLAMVDRGEGTVMPDGTQRGKITDKEKKDLRRGIDMFLDEKQTVKMMSASVDYDKRNTVCFVKKYTHKAMNERGFSQFLLACLPEDRTKWRADSNAKEMRKPNAMVREYVNQLLALPDSGYTESLRRVDEYARNRTKNEGLSGKEYRTLYRQGQERIIRESMNSVYRVLSEIPESELQMHTPMMDSMAMDYADMSNEAASDPMIEFGFKLRSYKSRLDHHKKEAHNYHDAVKEYEKQEESGDVNEASRALYEFLLVEEEYNDKLLAKYNHFLKFIPPSSEYMQGFEELIAYSRRIDNLRDMMNDSSMKMMTSQNAEDYGMKVYNERGGMYTVTSPQVLENRLNAMTNTFDTMREAYRVHLADYGLSLNDENQIENHPKYEFDEVKALDLHHLMYDFPYDIDVSIVNANAFVEMADRRYEAFQKAKEYLISTDQDDTLVNFPVDDIELMHQTAERFRDDPVIRTLREEPSAEKKESRTVRIDYDFYVRQEEEVKTVIKNTINSLQYE